MKRREVIIMGLMFIGSLIAVFLPDVKPHTQTVSAKELLYEVNKQGRYVSTDEVAKMIMESDPSLLLIDIRTPQDFKKYTIQGAINVPFDSILNKNNIDYFNQDVYTTVIFSNGSSLADQAWLMLRSYDYQGNKVMKGGLNRWYQTIINPQKPADEELSAKNEDLYLFRKGAQIYFTGINPVGNAPAAKPKAPSKPIVKRKKKEVSGGCG